KKAHSTSDHSKADTSMPTIKETKLSTNSDTNVDLTASKESPGQTPDHNKNP
ncbi:hypothetical protein A2U01_0099578, partial [Trifolium medium]|nr:hypothetical protein [Trifolium medium]